MLHAVSRLGCPGHGDMDLVQLVQRSQDSGFAAGQQYPGGAPAAGGGLGAELSVAQRILPSP